MIKVLVLSCLLLFGGSSVASAAIPDDQLPNNTWAGIEWKHTNVSGWSKNLHLKSVTTGGTISFPWSGHLPSAPTTYGVSLAGNVWAIVYYHGKWVAFTWDFLRAGQSAKQSHAIVDAAYEAGLHWHPVNGEEIYIFVSGLARSSDRNVASRSNVVRNYWGQGTTTPPPPCTAPPKIDYFTSEREGSKVLIKWKIRDAKWAGLYGSDGYERTIPTGPIVEGSAYLPPFTGVVTLAMRANNSCGSAVPKEVTVSSGGIPWSALLLLKKSGEKEE